LQAVEVNFDGITYAKGAAVLKQLAAYVGMEDFLAAMRCYFERHKFGNTTLADLLSALAEASGRDLSHWSAQWLETAGINTLRAEAAVDGEGRYSSFAVLQSPPADAHVLRDHRLAIGLYAVDGDKLIRVHRVELDVSGPRTDVPELVGVTRPDLLIVNDDDLTYCKMRLDGHSLATVLTRIGDLSESLPRALCWAAAWDMTRDGELAARDYLRLVLAGAAEESDIGVLHSLHRHAITALADYAEPAWAPQGLQGYAEAACQAMLDAAPGSDHQLAWVRTFAQAARSADHLAMIGGLLDGTVTINGLRVDAELRWSLLQALVALGASGDAEIEAELTRDLTASGQRRAATARALRPTAEAKAEAWRLATEDDEQPNAISEATIRGFQHPAQGDLLAPYAERYFDVVGEVWQRRSSEVAQTMVTGLFPSVTAQSTVDFADAYLGGHDVPPALRRLLLEGRSEVVRALRARARDAAAG
jgi:aminopeptidase N